MALVGGQLWANADRVTRVAAATQPHVTAVAAGYYHGLALMNDGTVWAWGTNNYYQLGTTVSDQCGARYPCGYTPRPISGLSGVIAIAGGGEHSLALESDGTVWIWGANFTAQLGNGTYDNDAHPSPAQVAFPGGITTSSVTLTPAHLDFGNQPLGSTSPEQQVTVTNTAATPLVVTSVSLTGANPSDFAVGGDGCTNSVLPQNGSCTLGVTFSPTATDRRGARLSIADSAADSPQTAALSGMGGLPAVSLAPASLTFGPQTVGTSSPVQTLTLTNSGTGALVVTNVTSSSGDFMYRSTCTRPLAPGASCLLDVTFTPAAAGSRSGSLTIVDNAPDSPQTVALGGTGAAPSATVSPTSLTFGKQLIGVRSPTQAVTVTNTGASAVTITGFSLGPNDTDFGLDSSSYSVNLTLAPGQSCTIEVFFSPKSDGLRTGTLTITDTAPGSPQTVTLQGQGPVRGIMFVHGIGEDYRQYKGTPTGQQTWTNYFAPLIDKLKAQYGANKYTAFQNFEDRGASPCQNRPVPPIGPSGLPITLPPPGQLPICDSQDPIAVNAVLLDGDLQDQAQVQGVDRITIVANSMGGAIARAYLAYAMDIHSPSLQLVDGVVFLQGAQEGSYLGAIKVWLDQHPVTAPISVALSAAVIQQYQINPSRLAIADLTPRSPLYQYVNQGNGTIYKYIPTNLAYANVASDIQLQPSVNIYGGMVYLQPLPVGDFLLLPGDDNPAATPLLGGARFDPLRFVAVRSSSTQWILPGSAGLQLDLHLRQNASTLITQLPQSHLTLDSNMQTIAVPNAPSINQAVFDWIIALDTGNP